MLTWQFAVHHVLDSLNLHRIIENESSNIPHPVSCQDKVCSVLEPVLLLLTFIATVVSSFALCWIRLRCLTSHLKNLKEMHDYEAWEGSMQISTKGSKFSRWLFSFLKRSLFGKNWSAEDLRNCIWWRLRIWSHLPFRPLSSMWVVYLPCFDPSWVILSF